MGIGGTIFLLGLRKDKTGLFLSIFLLMYQGVQIKGFEATILYIIFYFGGYFFYKLQKRESIWKNIHYKRYLAFILISLFLSLLALILRGDYSDLNLGIGLYSVKRAFRIYMVNFVGAIMLYILITNEIRTHQDILRCIWAFMLSLIYIFICWIGSYVFDLGLPGFLQTKYSGGGATINLARFAGLSGAFGLMSEYFLVIIAFSLIFIFSKKTGQNKKLMSIIAAILALPMAISTGTRSFVVVLFVFALIASYLFLKKSTVKLPTKVGILLILPIVFSGIIYQMRKSYLLERLEKTYYLSESLGVSTYTIDKILNRPYIQTFKDVREVGGLIGVGPIQLVGVRDNLMCHHSLYYDMLVKFGMIGILVYLLFYFKLAQGLYKKIRFEKRVLYIFLFSLFISLLLSEYARSYQDQASSFMLMYWFLFALIACVNNLRPNEGPGNQLKS